MNTSNEKIVELYSAYKDKGILKEFRKLNYKPEINSEEIFNEINEMHGNREENFLGKLLDTLREKYSEEDITNTLKFLDENIDTFRS